jgi:predicted MPP superfamily phosphohydrolase
MGLTLQGTIVLLLVLLTVCAIYGLELVLFARYVVGQIRRRPRPNVLLSAPAIVLHTLAIVGLGCMLYGTFIEPTWIEVNTVTLRTTKLKDTTFRIVQISDLHCDVKPRNEQRLVEIVNDLKPDVVVATGDYLNHPSALPRLVEVLKNLDAPLEGLAVEGNFDVRSNVCRDAFAEAGFAMLRRDTVVVAKDEEAIGISGLQFGRPEAYRELLADLPGDRFNVFLYHMPDLVEDAAEFPVDLYLCGHTHGGQVALPFYGAVITFSKFGKRYESGLYHVGATTLYVNRGLGLEPRPAPQMRFLARPEVTVFDIGPQ